MISHHRNNLSLVFVFVSTVLSTFLFTSQVLGAIPIIERDALIAIYNDCGGENWRYDDNWLGAPGTEGDWEGVTVENGHVTRLYLARTPLIGSLPMEIGNLTFLKSLNLGNNYRSSWSYNDPPNQIQEPLPAEMGNLTALDYLNLVELGFKSLPESLGQLSNLKEFNLNENELESLPNSFGNLVSLERFYLRHNQLTTLPGTFGNLESLRYINLDGNPLETLPVSMGDIPKLERVSIAFTPYLPEGFGYLNQITTLEICCGRRLDEIGETRNRRDDICCSGADELPAEIGNCSSLQELLASGNRFTSIPEEITNLAPTLEVLDLNVNFLPEDPSFHWSTH